MGILRNTLIVISGWWLFLAIAHAAIVHDAGYSWEQSIADAFISNSILALLSLGPVNTFRFYRPDAKSVFSLILWIALPTVLYAWLAPLALQFLSVDDGYMSFLEQTKMLRLAVGFLCSGCLVLMMWVWQTILQKDEVKARHQEAEKLARETELRSLRSQLQPHFLFNSLNSISALAGSRPEEARTMIQNLSDFLRSTLAKDESTLIPLADELHQLQLYLDIEKIRFGHRLKISVRVNEDALHAMLPALLLQPVVENAIKFGLYGNLGDVEITVSAEVSGNYLHIAVSNPYDIVSVRGSEGTGFGLSSIERRLYLLYGRRDLLKTAAENTIFKTHITIPQMS